MRYRNYLTAVLLFMVYGLVMAHDHLHIHHRVTGSVFETVSAASACCRHHCESAEQNTGCPNAVGHDDTNDGHDGNCEVIQIRPGTRCSIDDIYPQIADTEAWYEAASFFLSQSCCRNTAIAQKRRDQFVYKDPLIAQSHLLRAPPAYM